MSQDDSDKPDNVPEIHLDPEVIHEMKRMGQDKPAGLPWSKWKEPQELNHRHDEILSLMLEGRTKRSIADALGYEYGYVVTITNSPKFRREYAELRKTKNVPVDKKRIQEAFERAVDVLQDVMLNPEEKGSVRLSAAQYVIDQSVGKAAGEVSVKTTGLIDVIHRLDELRNVTPIQATNVPNLDSTISEADAVLDRLIPKDFVVGKKSEADEDGEIPEAES